MDPAAVCQLLTPPQIRLSSHYNVFNLNDFIICVLLILNYIHSKILSSDIFFERFTLVVMRTKNILIVFGSEKSPRSQDVVSVQDIMLRMALKESLKHS